MCPFFCVLIDKSAFSRLLFVKIKIAFVAAASQCFMSFKSNAAYIPVNAIIAQAESGGKLFAAEQFAIFHIRALQNVNFVMTAVICDFVDLKARFSVEHRAYQFVKNLKEKRSDKRNFRRGMKSLSVGLDPCRHGVFDKS